MGWTRRAVSRFISLDLFSLSFSLGSLFPFVPSIVWSSLKSCSLLLVSKELGSCRSTWIDAHLSLLPTADDRFRHPKRSPTESIRSRQFFPIAINPLFPSSFFFRWWKREDGKRERNDGGAKMQSVRDTLDWWNQRPRSFFALLLLLRHGREKKWAESSKSFQPKLTHTHTQDRNRCCYPLLLFLNPLWSSTVWHHRRVLANVCRDIRSPAIVEIFIDPMMILLVGQRKFHNVNLPT